MNEAQHNDEPYEAWLERSREIAFRERDALAARLAEAEALLAEGLRRYPPHRGDPFPSKVRAFLAPRCPMCHGAGAIDAPTSDDDPSCPECDGEGTADSADAPRCTPQKACGQVGCPDCDDGAADKW